MVRSLLGQGGMGAVYTVQHETTGVEYALKVLLAVDDAVGRARFEREGQAQASLPPHPNVVRVFGAGELQGIPYLLTELAPGGDLRMRLRQGPVPPLEACGMFAGLARALDHLHTHGVLHRDLKPHNIVFGADGAPKLMDFGLATLKGAEKLTVTGAFMGTPNYMAPEQVDGQKVDARADVYGLGATLYHALCARPPYDGESGVNMITKILTQPPRSLRSMQPDLPADVIRVTERAMARGLEQRYPTAGAFADDLARVAAGEPLDPPPPTPRGGRRTALLATGGVLVLATLAAGAAVALRPPPGPPPSTTEVVPAAVPSAAAPGGFRFPRPAGRKGTVFLPAGTTSVPRPTWLQPTESIRRGEAVTAPVLRGDLPIGQPVEIFQVSAGEAFVLRLELVRLPPGVVALEDGKFMNEADGMRLVFVPGGAGVGPFFLGEREVTWAQYLRFAAATGHSLVLVDLAYPEVPGSSEVAPVVTNGQVVQITIAQRGPEYPVVNVTADDARDYGVRLGLRLPTRAEWYHAYEGNKVGAYPAGEGRPATPRGNISASRERPSPGPHPPGSRDDDVTWCGALDMFGNVSEWGDALAEGEGGVKGLGQSCGGAYDDDLQEAEKRDRPAQENRPQRYRGMRLVCSLERSTAPAPLPP